MVCSAAVVTAVALASGAFAQQQQGVSVRTVTVRFGDLDLSTTAGAKTLYQRIRGAARTVCGEEEDYDLGLDSRRYWNSCYQSGLRASHEHPQGAGALRLICDEQGRVTGASLAGIDMADVASCIRTSAMGVIIPNADTGQAWATISLTFSVHE